MSHGLSCRPEGDVTLRRTTYSADDAAAVLVAAAGTLPGINDVVGNVRTPNSDVEAIEAFKATVRVQQAHG